MPAADTILCNDGCNREPHLCAQTTDGGWWHRDEVVQLSDGTLHHIDDTVVCHDQVRRHHDDCVFTPTQRWYPREECVPLISGNYMPRTSDDIVQWESGDWAWRDESVCVEGEWHSHEDATHCDQCCEGMFMDDSHWIGDTPLCQSCFDNHAGTCDSCGEYEWSDELEENDDGEYVCRDCGTRRTIARANPVAPRLITDYCDRTANHLPPTSTDKLLFGIELEVEHRAGASLIGAEFVRQHLPTTYCTLKTDGSLGMGGFEIVTRPDSVLVHHAMMLPLLTSNPGSQLRSWTTGRCGMHVHVSRAPLSQLQIGKMLCFLNDPLNERFVIKVAGRRSERWSKIAKKKVSDVLAPAERYAALNLCNSRTIEFRIFRGTLNKDTFFKNLEFCAALVEFTAPAARSIADATSAHKFMNWVDGTVYPHLYAWLVRRGLIVDRRKRRAG